MQLHVSAERAAELLSLSYGDITSTGRQLSNGSPAVSLQEVEEWAKSPTPQRRYDYHNNRLNSDKWDMCFSPRTDDIVINTAYKSGTTWMQCIIANILFKGQHNMPGWNDPDFLGIIEFSPWLELRMTPPAKLKDFLESQTQRRFVKCHMPLDGMPYYKEVKYVMLARDLRDVAYSWHNHWRSAAMNALVKANEAPDRIGPPCPFPGDFTPRETYLNMAGQDDGATVGLWSYYHHLATWWQYRHLPNILIIHYADLKKDPRGNIKKVAEFLGETLSDDELDLCVKNTTIESMRENHEKCLGHGFGRMMETGDGVPGGLKFINKGTNGRWKDELSTEDINIYLEEGKRRLGEECMRWLMHESSSF